uniref:Uncharacterized protein n=1 Tax=Anguilla anguilla TaxID=7936 RepID=A0A0E9SHF3_ANGAN
MQHGNFTCVVTTSEESWLNKLNWFTLYRKDQTKQTNTWPFLLNIVNASAEDTHRHGFEIWF